MTKNTNKPVSTVDGNMKKSASRKKTLNRKPPLMLALEARLMFDGAVAPTVDQAVIKPEVIVPQVSTTEAKVQEPILEVRPATDSAAAPTVEPAVIKPEVIVPQVSTTETKVQEPALETVSYTQARTEESGTNARADTLRDQSPDKKQSDAVSLLKELPESATEISTEPQRVILVSGYLPQVDQIIKELPINTTTHILRADGHIVEEISQILTAYAKIEELHIVSH